LHDLHGNVWQWCQDSYGEYGSDAVADPQGPAQGTWRMLRGGSAFDFPADCRSACRGRCGLDYSQYFIGFRVVMETGK
jgi:formylglycine-generating enzyme required for sulfatase activity